MSLPAQALPYWEAWITSYVENRSISSLEAMGEKPEGVPHTS